MRKFAFLCALFAIAAVLVASPAGADIQSTLVLNEVNELEDIDFEVLFLDQDGDRHVEDGDKLVAILEVTRLNVITGIDGDDNNSTTSTEVFSYDGTRTFTGVAMIVVDGDPSISGGGTTATYSFKPPTSAQWAEDVIGLTNVDDGVMAILFDDPVGTPHIDPNAATLPDAIDTATEGIRLWEFGFTGDPDEFWRATTIDFGGDPTDIDDIDLLFFLAALNVVDPNAGLPLLLHNALGDPDLSGDASALFTSPVALQLQGNLETGGSGPHFDIATDTNLYIKPLPEPGTMAVWVGLAAVGGLFAVRRRRRASAG